MPVCRAPHDFLGSQCLAGLCPAAENWSKAAAGKHASLINALRLPVDKSSKRICNA